MRILNVGCGKETYGTDFIDIYPSREGVKKCDINNDPFPFGSNTFDEVYSRNLFEHLRNPSMVLREMVRVCRPGGRVVVITDNASYWKFSLPDRPHTGGYSFEEYPEDTHYSLFTDFHLKNHFEAAGLVIESVKYETDPNSPRNPLICFGREIISYALRVTPFWRMSYCIIKITGRKK